MAALANITIKKHDGVTDIVWTGIVPSSGSEPAVWKSLTVGTAPAHQPEFRLAFKANGAGDKRVGRGTFSYPQIATNTTTGVTSVIDRFRANYDILLPLNMSSVDVNEASAQFGNLMAAALIKQLHREGYSAT